MRPASSVLRALASQARAACWTGTLRPSGMLSGRTSVNMGSAGVDTSVNWAEESPPVATPTRSSAQPDGVRCAMSKGRLSSSSLAITTPTTGLSSRASSTAATVVTWGRAGCSALWASDSSTAIQCSASLFAHSGSAASTVRARVPGPAPQSITVNGAGRSNCSHQRSNALARTAPNSGPTSGDVRKWPLAAPERPPRM